MDKKLIPRDKQKLTYLKWQDAHANSGWFTEDEIIEKVNEEICLVEDVGWVIKENKMGPNETVEGQNDSLVSFKDVCFDIRKAIEGLKKETICLKNHGIFKAENAEGEAGSDRGEMKANIMLAYRHLEDARMRLGKAVQAYDGGKSVYSK